MCKLDYTQIGDEKWIRSNNVLRGCETRAQRQGDFTDLTTVQVNQKTCQDYQVRTKNQILLGKLLYTEP
jgi:hypothetical protein